MARMRAPADNKSGAGYDGKFYAVDEKGIVDVPDVAVPELLSHGFTLDVEDDAPPAPEAGKGKKGKRDDTPDAPPAPEDPAEG